MERMAEGLDSVSPVSTRSRRSSLSSSQAEDLARRAARNSRVHFDEEGDVVEVEEEEHPIILQLIDQERGKVIGVYLGFLKEFTKYLVRFRIPAQMYHGSLTPPPATQLQSSSQGNQHKDEGVLSRGKGEFCEVIKAEWTLRGNPKGGERSSDLEVEMEVRIPGTKGGRVFEDTVGIGGEVGDGLVLVALTGKVMGSGMGTPRLKDGVKCLGAWRGLNDSSSSSDSDEGNVADVPPHSATSS